MKVTALNLSSQRAAVAVEYSVLDFHPAQIGICQSIYLVLPVLKVRSDVFVNAGGVVRYELGMGHKYIATRPETVSDLSFRDTLENWVRTFS